MRSINPTTGAPVYEVADITLADAVERAEAARRAQNAWGRRSFALRSAPLRRVASLLRERAEDLAGLMADEMGKPLRQGHAEAQKSARVCEYYARHARGLLAPRRVEIQGGRGTIAYRPLGVVLAIMPWTSPFWQVLQCAAPALMAGNAVLLKHAPGVPACARAAEALMTDAGLPRDLFINLCLPESEVGGLIDHPAVAAVSLTGSSATGRVIAARAGAVLKPCVLELGGSDAYLVLEDADLGSAVEVCARARLVNSGQSSIAARRFVVVEALREEFERRLVERFKRVQLGAPRGETVEVGPLASVERRELLQRQVDASVAGGARLLLGGELPEGPGAFYPPTVLTDVGPGTPAYDEELMGPVAAVLPAADEADALRIAGDNGFGLGAAVFTTDAARGEELVTHELEAGTCSVNRAVLSDPFLPFGGVRASGSGRLLGPEGIRSFVYSKVVYAQ